MRVIFLTSLIGADIEYQSGTKTDLPKEKATKLIDGGICNPYGEAAKKEYAEYKAEIKRQADEKLEKEKQASAILYNEELTKERVKLQSRIDEITHMLDDGSVYYKSYIDLADDLEKQNANSDNSQDDTLQLDGEQK